MSVNVASAIPPRTSAGLLFRQLIASAGQGKQRKPIQLLGAINPYAGNRKRTSNTSKEPTPISDYKWIKYILYLFVFC